MKSKTKLLRSIINFFPRKYRMPLEFFVKTGYFPKVDNPTTFNEKIQYRKVNWSNPLFVKCCDKLRVRDYVEEMVGGEILIPLLYQGDAISFDALKKILVREENVVIKINNDSGSVFFAKRTMKNEQLEKLCEAVNYRVNNNFGMKVEEGWYSKVSPCVIVEKDIACGRELNDYKLHVFRQEGSEPHIVFHLDYGRFTEGRGRTFYDAEYQIMNVRQKAFKIIRKDFPVDKETGEKMKSIAARLAQDFSYVRVDLYYIDGHIYFGELTFAPGSGFTAFASKEQDKFFGDKWVFSADN